MSYEELTVGIIWHGRFMALAWVFLVPIGILMARFFKVLPNQSFPDVVDSRFWWNSHWMLQGLATAITAAAVTLILLEPEHALMQNVIHRFFGWATVVLCAVQFLSGLLRGTKGGPSERWRYGTTFGDHYNMTVRRLWFERIHKANGYVVFILSLATVQTGLWTARAPLWMPVIIAIWWTLLFVIFIYLQRRGWRVDTYYAIWGHPPDEASFESFEESPPAPRLDSTERSE